MHNLPVTTSSLELYLTQINQFPLLSADEEFELATRFREKGDIEAAHRLITSNLRFVVKVALEYRSYGVKLLDLIQEGNIGLMMAVKKFDPRRGYRLISYAIWWIRAYIQNFIIKTWSLVKIGTTQTQKKLFYSLGKTKRLLGSSKGDEKNIHALAEALDVKDHDIVEMEQRMSLRDFSLDSAVDEDSQVTHLDLLADERPNQEELVGQMEEERERKGQVRRALRCLSSKEKYVIEKRIMSHHPATLQEIGDSLNLSRERIRQIENEALKKLRNELEYGLQAATA
ncbi:MAG: RNA polymerase sigma factor RpoH [Deltaproteobacteria bacterium]|nr:RNA polymerase sigma factor RpoH [Deltaproteobacteria bacterium]MBW2123332.1 RNA polymerase sigma factor RpoH [Deltaproteobacteria bacterium]